MNPLVEVRELSKAFLIPRARRDTVRAHFLNLFRPNPVDRLVALEGVSFEVRPGEALGLMGRNGSGKSTLLKLLCGIYLPDGGSVTVRAPITPILELGVGWNVELDAIDNILLIGTVMGMSLKQARAAVQQILAFADLERFARLQLKHYSSGMAARLAYSTAFSAVRDLLIIDEVFAVGDAGFRAKCFERCRELSARGHTLIVVSHDPGVIKTFCHRALLLEGGRITEEGSPEEVANAYLRLLSPPEPRPALAQEKAG